MAFGVDEAEAGLQDYGQQLLRAGADLTGRSAGDIVSADMKAFESGPVSFSVSQVEVTNFEALTERLPEVREALHALQEQRKSDFAVLLVTDIVQNNSLLVGVGNNRYLERMPFAHKWDGVWDLPGIVSRKKQLLPTLLGMLQG
jgi:manganese-dependent inorganic pyrophosphatase